jgi:type II secretory pathway pseudopilin PulG
MPGYTSAWLTKKNGRSRGVTLIELMIAIAGSALVIGAAMYAWSRINTHIARNQRNALLHREAAMITDRIASQLQRTPRVLSWHYYGITYVNPAGGDTIAYEYYGDELLRNDTALSLISGTTRITGFEVDIRKAHGEEALAGSGLVSFAITFEDEFGAVLQVDRQVSARLARQGANSHDGADWNF